MSVKLWCVGYLGVALVFGALLFLGLVKAIRVRNRFVFGAFCGVPPRGLALHVMYHINEEDAHPTIMG